MLIKEFRVTLPLTVEEYQVAQLYSVAEASKNETGGGEGIEVLKNEPFDNYPLLGGKYSKGQYTYKIYHLASKVPTFIRILAPKGSLEIHEEAWNAYPYCKTVLTNPHYMKEKFILIVETLHVADSGKSANVLGVTVLSGLLSSLMFWFCVLEGLHWKWKFCVVNWSLMPFFLFFCLASWFFGVGLSESWIHEGKLFIIIESYHIEDCGNQDNVHELPPEKLKQREVVHIDIANDPVAQSDYKSSEDPKIFKSEKTGRGPLTGEWTDKVSPVMTCYKLVTVEFKWFGIQNRVENFIQKAERRLLLPSIVFCWMDRWHGLTMADIRAIEEKTKEELDKQRNVGQVRGMKAESD